jgi:hypothetical protein
MHPIDEVRLCGIAREVLQRQDHERLDPGRVTPVCRGPPASRKNKDRDRRCAPPPNEPLDVSPARHGRCRHRLRGAAQRRGELTGRRVSVGRDNRQRLGHRTFDHWRHRRPHHLDARQGPLQLSGNDSLRGGARVRRLPNEHLKYDASQAVDIRAAVYAVLPRRLLGAHVRHRSYGDAGLRQRLTA